MPKSTRRRPATRKPAGDRRNSRAAIAPPAGLFTVPDDPIVGASTEVNGSDKVGSGGPTVGTDKSIGPLDRIRVNSTKRTLPNNDGVSIGDNPDSLKAELPGPTLLEDFFFGKRSRTSTTSVFPSGSCMPAARR